MRTRQIALSLAATLSMASATHAQTLQPLTVPAAKSDTARGRDTTFKPTVFVFAEGAIRSVVSKPSDTQSTSGSLGMRYLGSTFITTGLVNIAGSAEAVTSAWGATLLAPAAGKTLNAGLLDIRLRHLGSTAAECSKPTHGLACNQSAHFYATVGSRKWATKVDTAKAAIPDTSKAAGAEPSLTIKESYEVPVWGMGLSYSYSFFQGKVPIAEQPAGVAMAVDIGVATRHLRGDLFARDSVRTALLRTSRRDFIGLEVGLSMQLNQISSNLTYYYMSGNVDGFSKGQVVAGASLSTPIGGGALSP